MDFRKLLAASTAMVALSSLTAGHAVADTSSASGVANVLAAATVTNAQNLNFGTFTAASGTVTVDTAGAAGGSIATTGQSNGAFDFTAGDATPIITVILNDLSETGTGTDVLDVTSVSVAGAGLAGTLSGTAATVDASAVASGTGTATSGTGVGIGGGISVDATDAAGSYAGTLQIVVTNN